MYIFRKNKYLGNEIDPDEIFIDSSNLPEFDTSQFEGRLEKAISKRTFFVTGLIAFVIFLIFGSKIWALQISEGQSYSELSDNNSLKHAMVIASRGVVYDRNGLVLISNEVNEKDPEFPARKYNEAKGLSHVLGYVSYPLKDKSGYYYSYDYIGKDGVEKAFNEKLSGKNGARLVEVNALGQVQSANLIFPPTSGENLKLSIDSEIQSKLYEFIESLSADKGFEGGAGAIMDVNNGELIAITSFPEYSSSVLSHGDDSKKISEFLNDKRKVFLNRAVSGLYTPGSITKPFLSIAALEEGIISPNKEILSTGSISIPNPYDPTKKTVFNDWKAHGYVDMRDAIAVSSDVYFYAIGGGFEKQKGLGIQKIINYLKLFGFEKATSGELFDGPAGVIPSPEWKRKNFDGDEWRIGDTYNTSIGQYGMQVTLLQSLRAVSSIANGGYLIDPTILLSENKEINKIYLGLSDENIEIAKEGMRQAVLSGTAKGLNVDSVKIAGKTGTAELGSRKQFVNSWIVGFFPYDKPKYAFAVVMEKGPHNNTVGALYVMRQLVDWMSLNNKLF